MARFKGRLHNNTRKRIIPDPGPLPGFVIKKGKTRSELVVLLGGQNTRSELVVLLGGQKTRSELVVLLGGQKG